jgi:hypothetical protein
MQAALGVRVHSGWAVVVAVGGEPKHPAVLNRRRIEICDLKIVGSKQPYHAAERLELTKAQKLVDHCRTSTTSLASAELLALVNALSKRGVDLVGCGLLISSAKTVSNLATILASHALIHSAEGDFFRRAIAEAAEKCSLTVTAFREKEIYERAASEFKSTQEQLATSLSALGKTVGPPWTEDEKLATLAAQMVLAQQLRANVGAKRAASRATA